MDGSVAESSDSSLDEILNRHTQIMKMNDTISWDTRILSYIAKTGILNSPPYH
jgi:hypothetical protein